MFVISNFNYCFLVWISIVKQNRKTTENSFTLLLDNYDDTFEDLQEKSRSPSMNLEWQRTLCKKINKNLNKLNQGYMNDIFKLRNTDRLTPEKYKLNLEIPKPN